VKLRLAAAIAAVALPASLLTATLQSPTADAAARHFKSCTALNKVYPHGVGMPSAKDHTSGKRVTNFKKSSALYKANNGPRNPRTGEYDLDRDNDKIACEKR
jgi:hypothetical protein